MSKERLIELIDQTPYIRKKFHEVRKPMLYISQITGKLESRENVGYTEYIIYDDHEFILWQRELLLELSQLKPEPFIKKTISELKRINGFHDEILFGKTHNNLRALKNNIDAYIVDNKGEKCKV